jgi:hypothetical protein
MTSESPMLATIRTALPQRLQIVISILNTRLSRCAQVISLCSSASGSALFVLCKPCLLLPLPRCAGVTLTRCLLFGARTP